MSKRIIITGVNRSRVQPWATARVYWLLENYLVRNYKFELYNVLSKDKIVDGAKPLPKDTEIISIRFSVHNANFAAVMHYLNCCPKASIIFFPGGDRRMWDNDRDSMRPFLERVSFIFDGEKDSWPRLRSFEEAWPEYADKHIFLPNCVAPESEWFCWEYNQNPVPKCLFSGRVGGRYEMRNLILAELVKDAELAQCVDVLRHPDYNFFVELYDRFVKQLKSDTGLSGVEKLALKALNAYKRISPINPGNEWVIRWEYQKLLSNYLCGLAVDGSRVNTSVMMKHLEIPAVGGLMVSGRTPDLDRMGFIPGKHYIAVTMGNIIETIKEICGNPKGYEDIRWAGMKFVRENHGISNRYKKVKEVIDGLLV